MKNSRSQHSSLVQLVLAHKPVAIAICGLLVAGATALLLGTAGPRARVQTDHPSSPEEWEDKGFASFTSSMAELYEAYDARAEGPSRVNVSGDHGVIADGDQAPREAEVRVTEGGVTANAWGVLEALGYACMAEGEGLRASSAHRGDEVLVLPDRVEVNGEAVDAGVGMGETGLAVDVGRLGEAMGYEVISSDNGDITLQDPWETARVVAMGAAGIDDPNAESVVPGPNGMTVLQYGTVREARKAAERIAANGDAAWVGPDRLARLSDDAAEDWSPADALSWGNAYIGSTEMQVGLVNKHGSVASLPEVVVAVVDSGVDVDHELFAGRLVDGYDFADNDDVPDATHAHGSHVAGIVVNNTAENVRVMPLRAGADENLPETAIYSSIEYAISHGADVINMSYGSEYASSEDWLEGSIQQQAIRDAEQAGIVLVAAHGNDAKETGRVYPSSDDAVIGVTAIDSFGRLASFSNFGSPVDLCAPGDGINSAALDGSYEYQSGTSMAAPFVSAASALVLSDDANMSASAVRQLLQDNATDLGEAGWDELYGHGCVSVSGIIGGQHSVTEGWERNGTCEQRVDGNGVFTVRPINGISGVPNDTPAGRLDIVEAVIEPGVVVPNAGGFFKDCKNLVSIDASGMRGMRDTSFMCHNCSSLESFVASGWDTSAVTNMRGMFMNCVSLEAIDVSGWDTSSVTDMVGVFAGCHSLPTIDVSGWNTASVTGMSNMFHFCVSLTHLDVSGWDTSSVRDMNCMFYDCESLEALDLSQWNTASVTDMSHMFHFCKSLTDLDVSGWDTSSVRSISAMFYNCASLEALDLSQWDTSSVVDMSSMFAGGNEALTSLDVSTWDTSSVENMAWMFTGCTALPSLDVSSWDVSSVVDMSYMFANLSSVSQLDLRRWETASVKSMREMFNHCPSLTTFDASGWDTSSVTDMNDMFRSCSGLISLDASGWDISSVSDVSQMFEDCTSLTSLETSGWDPSSVVDMREMFKNCASLTSLDISGWDTSHVTDMNEMFADCANLTSVDATGWDTSSVTDMFGMFNDCASLSNIAISGWDTSSVTDMRAMFGGCTSLSSVDVSSWDTSSVTDMREMFRGCSSLDALDSSGWDTSKVTDMYGMFQFCPSLARVDATNWDTSSVTTIASMFAGCSSLIDLDVSGWDTSSITDMLQAFGDCSALGTINVSGWDTSHVRRLSYAFDGCRSLTELDVSKWDISSVADMIDTFKGCESLASIDVSSWDTASVTVMRQTFSRCTSLPAIDVSKWDTSSVTDMNGMFGGCKNLTSIDVSGWDTSSVTDMNFLFSECVSLASVSLPANWPMSLDGSLPAPTASNGKWWSVRDESWYDLEEIAGSRAGIADTYVNPESSTAIGVDATIRQLPAPDDLTLGDAPAVSAAREAFDALTEDQKALVTQLPALEAAEAKVAELRADAAAARSVDEAIAALPAAADLTLGDAPAVAAARKAYRALTEDQRALVTQLPALEAAEARVAKLRAARGVDEAIAALPAPADLSLSDAAAVSAARASYDALTDDQRALVANLAALEAAEARMSELRAAADKAEADAAAARGVDEAIAALPAPADLSLSDATAVSTAREAFDALTDDQRGLVTQLPALEAAEARITELRAADKAEADAAAARGVDEAIAALPAPADLTLGDSAAVSAARTSYDALTEDQRALVANLAALEAAEARMTELRAAADKAEADAAAAASVDALIAALPAAADLTLEDAPAVAVARLAYRLLAEDRKALVTRLADLEAAEARVAELRAAASVDALIAALPDPAGLSLEDEARVADAREAFDALTEDQRALVANLAALEAAEARVAELRAEAEAVDEAIAALPDPADLSLSDAPAVAAAREAFDALAPDQKELIAAAVPSLEAAEARVAELRADAEAAASVDALIAALPAAADLTLEDAPAVSAAREAFDVLTEDQRGFMTQLPALEAAEAKVAELRAAADKAEVDSAAARGVDEAIAALPVAAEITLGDEAAVSAARAAYGALTDDQRALVASLAALEAAEARLAELRADAEAAASVDALVAALPAPADLSLSDAAAVSAARAAHDALTDDQRGLVMRLADLEAAEARLAELRAEAEAVGQLIAALPAPADLSLSDTAAVSAAREAFDALAPDQRELIAAAVPSLEAAEARVAELRADADAAASVDALVAALPALDDLSLGDEARVSAAREAHDALTDAQRGLVTQLPALEAAEARLAELHAEAEAVGQLIAALPAPADLSLSDAAAVSAAREAFDALTEDQRGLVTQLPALEAAEARMSELRAAADKAEADAAAARGVDEAIAALPAAADLTLGNAPAVAAAREAFDALTEDQRSLVTNLADLQAAEARLAELRADAEAAASVDALVAALPDPADLALSDAAVSAARTAHDALTEGQRALVTQLPALEAAEARMAELRAAADKAEADAAAARGVDEAIAALPDPANLSLGDEAAVSAARAAHDALTEDQRGLVSRLADLEAAEARVAELRAAADKAEADAAAARGVDEAIAALPAVAELSLSDADSVSAARASYDALTDDQRGLVSRLADLEAAEARMAELRAAADKAEADSAAARGVDEAIAALPAPADLSLSDAAAVSAARAAHDALTPDQRALVANLAALEAAEARLAELRAEELNTPFFLDASPTDESNHGAEVNWMGVAGISTGWSVDGGRRYEGLWKVKRCDFAAFLYRMADLMDDDQRNDSLALSDEEAARTLRGVSDCDMGTSHAKEVAWLIETGISRGWRDAGGNTVSFRPMSDIKRQDMAAFLYRFADLSDDGEQNKSPEYGSDVISFTDVRHGDEANHASEVEWLASVGVTKGWRMGSSYEFRGLNVSAKSSA